MKCQVQYVWTKKQTEVLESIRTLSGGTISTLTGLSTYTQTEEVQADWLEWVKEIDCPFEDWQSAWDAYKSTFYEGVW